MLVSDLEKVADHLREECLNPCFSGCWSRTLQVSAIPPVKNPVLILVLVDVGLGQVVSSVSVADECKS